MFMLCPKGVVSHVRNARHPQMRNMTEMVIFDHDFSIYMRRA